MNRQTDRTLFEQIRTGDEKAFEALFRAYYPFLCTYATRLVKDAAAAEEIVQELFVRLWENRSRTIIGSSVKNYLFVSVRNLALNHIRHNRIKEDYAKNIIPEQDELYSPDTGAQTALLERIEKEIESLPEKRREIFTLSRRDGLKYREIAEKLNVSVKTVETQMGLALKYLREKLKDCLPIF